MIENYGGKANSLIKLKNKKFNVPNFFVISSIDYEYFLDSNNLKEKIEILVRNKKYSEIQNIIMEANIPEKLKIKIEKEWKLLSTKHASVRSSAMNEDGNTKSFAGQYKTCLNVLFEDLYESIKKCWCSLYEENVILYSDNNDLYGMNVIIQEMIEPDYAGVAFSKDTTSNTGNYSIIEMVKGSGEKLVSGKITPTKFLIRRETLYTDLKIGDIDISNNILKQLEKILLEIETLYKEPVDIEYAIKDSIIYILQARPITASSIMSVPYSLSITRPMSIIEEEIYFKGEYEGIKKVTRDLYYFKPIFLYNKHEKNVGVYYNEFDLEEDPNMMYYYMDLDFEKTKQYYEIVKDNVAYLDNIINKKESIELDSYIDKIISIYPFSSLGQLAGHFENISERLRNILYDFRNNYDYIIHDSMEYLLEIIKENLPNELKDMSDYITLDEYKSKNFPNIDTVNERKKGYIYFEKLYTTDDYETWFKENNKYIKKEEESSLKGQTAFSGIVTGRVCKIFSENDFDKFKEGDILVTPMTVPKFIKVMKQASAIVTDEGGVTCHAAIISRELKIPCIVGCKNITKVLNNGDVIEVNANAGEISILSKCCIKL